MRRCLFVFSMLSVMGGVAHAQNQQIYTHVEQDSKELSDLGTAAFDVTTDAQPTVVFQDGKAVMTINGVTVATLPMSDDGELVVEHETTKEADALNKVSRQPTETAKYTTIYSPFQLKVPTNGQVHAPIYDETTNVLRFTDNTKIAAETIVPVETPMVVFGTTDAITFEFSTASSADTKITNYLSGSSLAISKPTDGTVFTYGFGKEEAYKNIFGLYKFVGANMAAGKAYLHTNTSAAAKANYVPMSFDYDDSTTGISSVQNVRETSAVGKFVKNGRLVIQKNGKMFNVSGQEVK